MLWQLCPHFLPRAAFHTSPAAPAEGTEQSTKNPTQGTSAAQQKASPAHTFPPTKASYSLEYIFQQVTGVLILRGFLPLAAPGAAPRHSEHDTLMTHVRVEIPFPITKTQLHPSPYLSHVIKGCH